MSAATILRELEEADVSMLHLLCGLATREWITIDATAWARLERHSLVKLRSFNGETIVSPTKLGVQIDAVAEGKTPR